MRLPLAIDKFSFPVDAPIFVEAGISFSGPIAGPNGAELGTAASEYGAYRCHAAAALPPPQPACPSHTRRETEPTIPEGRFVDGAGPYAGLEGWLFLPAGGAHAITRPPRDS